VAAVDAVILDVGGVLVVPHPDHVGPALEPFGAAGDVARYERAHYHGVAAIDADGEDSPHPADWTTYQRAYATALGVADHRLDAAVDTLWRALDRRAAELWSWVLPFARPGLAALEATGVPLAVVSNSDGTVEELLAVSGLCQVGPGRGVAVAAIVDSDVVGVAKPDPRIFTYALDALGVEPGRALYVGDTARFDVAGARAAGMQPVQLDPYGLSTRNDHPHVRALADVADLVRPGVG
jgi:putative hydrolase of the HAD superfamily